MNRLFAFFSKNESHHFLRIAAKVIRVFYIVVSFCLAVYLIITGVLIGNFITFLAYLLGGLVAFCVSMFMGMLVEAFIVGFSNIVENQFEELILKDKAEDVKDVFSLSKKQKAVFEKLDKLNELRKTGAITDEDYDAKKKEYLDKV